MQSLEFLGEDLQPDEGTYLGPVGLDRLSAAAGGPEWHATAAMALYSVDTSGAARAAAGVVPTG
jgi:hypothetical protein